ncbi:MAG: hypothetical protein R2940_00485 [Syntrophotaleaceae bacterium]
MKTFLVETCLVDRGGGFKPDYCGDHRDLLRFLENLFFAIPGSKSVAHP